MTTTKCSLLYLTGLYILASLLTLSFLHSQQLTAQNESLRITQRVQKDISSGVFTAVFHIKTWNPEQRLLVVTIDRPRLGSIQDFELNVGKGTLLRKGVLQYNNSTVRGYALTEGTEDLLLQGAYGNGEIRVEKDGTFRLLNAIITP